MTYAFINADMQIALEKVFAEYPAWMRQAWDLGSGSSWSNSYKLLRCGACGVVAVDKENYEYGVAGVVNVQSYFSDVVLPEYGISVAFVAWPQNKPSQLVSLLKRAQTIIYVGSNVNGSACGDTALFDFLTGCAIREHIPHPRNTFTVYARNMPRGDSGLTGEEYAAFHQEELFHFEEAEAAVQMEPESMYCRCEPGWPCKWCIMRASKQTNHT